MPGQRVRANLPELRSRRRRQRLHGRNRRNRARLRRTRPADPPANQFGHVLDHPERSRPAGPGRLHRVSGFRRRLVAGETRPASPVSGGPSGASAVPRLLPRHGCRFPRAGHPPRGPDSAHGAVFRGAAGPLLDHHQHRPDAPFALRGVRAVFRNPALRAFWRRLGIFPESGPPPRTRFCAGEGISGGDWRGVPEAFPFLLCLRRRRDIWGGLVPAARVDAVVRQAALASSQYWRDRGRAGRAAYFPARWLLRRPLCGLAWAELAKSAYRAAVPRPKDSA